MSAKKKLSPRKEPVQQRSLELRNSILEAATDVLKTNGPYGFTTNKVADRAGVNIASLYQYYPNKEALLFHLVEIEWNSTYHAVFPILKDAKKTSRERLLLFIEKFFETEAEEAELRQALSTAAVNIEQTAEYREILKRADDDFLTFFSHALKHKNREELTKKTEFIRTVILSFSEQLPKKSAQELRSDALMLGEMICEYFGIQ